jgi:hypothetical protein
MQRPVRTAVAVLFLAACGGSVAPVLTDESDASTPTPTPTPGPGPTGQPPPIPPPHPTPQPPTPQPPPQVFDASPPPIFDGGNATLYQRLGGHAGISSYMTAIITEELKDPQQASYFAYVGKPGHPAYADIVECMTDLVGSATGGPEVYPATTPSGYQCRSLQASHAYLHVPNGVFNAFLSVAAAVGIAAGVAPSDVAEMGALFGTTRGDIVDPTVGDGGYFQD